MGQDGQVVLRRSLGCKAGYSGYCQGHHFCLRSAGLCATTKVIADYFEENYFAHGHTYEAHPMTLGPAVATIEEMERLNLVERAASLEPYVRTKLEALKAKHPSIGDVRGMGLSGLWSL